MNCSLEQNLEKILVHFFVHQKWRGLLLMNSNNKNYKKPFFCLFLLFMKYFVFS